MKQEELIKKSIQSLQNSPALSEEQKTRIYHNVLQEGNVHERVLTERIRNLITVYPWRVAFGTAAVQSLVSALVFGSKYTNFICGFFRG